MKFIFALTCFLLTCSFASAEVYAGGGCYYVFEKFSPNSYLGYKFPGGTRVNFKCSGRLKESLSAFDYLYPCLEVCFSDWEFSYGALGVSLAAGPVLFVEHGKCDLVKAVMGDFIARLSILPVKKDRNKCFLFTFLQEYVLWLIQRKLQQA